MSWLLRKLAHGLPPLPTIGGRALATRVAGLLLAGGAILIAITVALPPAAEGSDLLILGYGAIAAVCGALLLSRRRVNEPVLGLAAALGTALITLATLEGGHMTGTEDNEVLFLWVSLFAFWFFDLRHALLQLGLIGVADAVLLIDQHPTFADGITRWLVLVATLLVTGLLMAWIRRSLERERDETAHLAVVAERMRIARDLHDAAGHGVTAISLQAATGLRAIDDGADVDEARHVLEEIKRTSRIALEDMRKLLGLLRPADASHPERDRVSLSHLDVLVNECRAAGLNLTVERSGEAQTLPPILDQTAYRIIQEALTNVLKHAGPGATATVELRFDPASVELEVVDDGPGNVSSVGLVVLVISIPIMGYLSDRHGRRPLLLICCAAFIILPWPLFTYLSSGNVPYIVLVLIQIAIAILISLYSGAGPAAIAEIFPTRSRSTWMTTGYALSVAIFGGSAPYLSIWMIEKLGTPIAPVWYLIAAAVVSFCVIWSLKETAHDELA